MEMLSKESSGQCQPEGLTPPAPSESGSLQVESDELTTLRKQLTQKNTANDKLKALLKEKDAVIDKLKTLLTQKDAAAKKLQARLNGKDKKALLSEDDKAPDAENDKLEVLEQVLTKKTAENEELRMLLMQKDAENVQLQMLLKEEIADTEKLRTPLTDKMAEYHDELKRLLAEKHAENVILTEKISRTEAELISEIETSGDLILEMMKMKDQILEKDIQVQRLNKAMGRREEIQDYLRRTASENSLLVTKMPHHLIMTSEQKVMHLFPDVLKIIIQNEGKVKNCIRWRDLLPLLTSCRLVCKSWKKTIDLILEEDPSHTDLCDETFFPPHFKQDFTPCPLLLSYDNFDKSGAFHKFIRPPNRRQKKNPSPDHNPIPTRHLMIAPAQNFKYDSDKWDNYCRIVKGYLEVVGKHVWYLTVWFTGAEDKLRDCVVVYKCLSEWLSLLSNLRSLCLYTWVSPAAEKWARELERKKMENISFPHFKDLITFECFRDDVLAYDILKHNRHIRKLGFSEDGASVPTSSVMGINFPNLSSVACEINDVEAWESFVNVANWKLEHIILGFYGSASGVLTAQTFFEDLSKIGGSLKSLTFNLSHVGRSDPEKVKLRMPQLTCLQVKCEDWKLQPLEHILVQLENLETLSLELSVSDASGGPSDTDKQAFLEYVNIFGEDKADFIKLPKLKRVKVAVKFNNFAIGNRYRFVLRRVNMPPVTFETVKIKDIHLEHDVGDQ